MLLLIYFYSLMVTIEVVKNVILSTTNLISVEVVRLDPIQLPFAQKSRPAPVYAVKKELAGDEVTYAVSSEIKPDQAVKVRGKLMDLPDQQALP